MAQNFDYRDEIARTRRRASTADSNGLDYLNTHRIDEDISARIRSLLISRHQHYPPRTPHASDEHPNATPAESNPLLGFDFSTAKSIGRAAKESGRLSLPAQFRRAFSRSDESSTSGRRKATEPVLSSIRASFPSLRSVSSANELNNTNDEDAIERASVERTAVSSPTGSKKRFRFPKLTLQDKRPSIRDNTIKSCIEITPHSPPDDVKIHETEMGCCPPCDARGAAPSKYITSLSEWPKAIKADPADLACFLAGCPAEQIDCVKHTRRPQSSTSRAALGDRRTTEELKSVAERLSRDAAELGVRLSISGLASGSEKEVAPQRRPYRQKFDGGLSSASSRPEQARDNQDLRLPGTLNMLTASSQKTATGISPLSSVTSGVSGGSDVFPHAAQSMAQTKETNFSTAITTNFSLPGYKNKKESKKDPKQFNPRPNLPPPKEAPQLEFVMNQKPPSDDISPRQELLLQSMISKEPKAVLATKESDGSLRSKRSKPKASSLLTGGSRSGIKHALLKPAISEETPVDTGLPIPPKLTPVYSWHEKDPAYVESSNEVAMENAMKNPVPGDFYLKTTQELLSGEECPPERDNIRSSQHIIKCNDIENEAHHRCYASSGGTSSPPPQPMAGIVANVMQARALADSVKVRVPASEVQPRPGVIDIAPDERHGVARGEAKEWPPKTAPASPAIETKSAAKSLGNIQGTQTSQNYRSTSPKQIASLPPKELSASLAQLNETPRLPPSIEEAPSQGSMDTVNAAYWGFVPEVNDAVQDAIQNAVRNAVQDVVVPRGAEQKQASEAYRQLVARSLNEAAKQADDWLRRPSIWDEAPDSVYESEATVITPARALRDIQRDYDTPDGRRIPPMRLPPQTRPDGAMSMSPDTNLGRPDNQARENLIMRPTSPDEMETVPLESLNKPVLDRQRTFNLKPWRRGKEADYRAIPTRGSSQQQVFSSTKRTGNQPEKIPMKVRSQLRPLRRSYERLSTRAGRDLRSTSSAEPLRREQPVREAYPKRIRDLRKERSSSFKKEPEGNTARKNTVQWLKDVLSSGGAYEPRFTELPPRTRRDENGSRIRSKTAPAMPVKDLYLGKTPEPVIKKPEPVVTRDGAKTTNVSEAFTRTINDLETLMNEALYIAKQATGTADAMHVPALLEGATSVLKCGRRGEESEIRDHVERRHIHKRNYPTRCSNGSSDIASVHESLLSYSASEDFTSEDAEPYVAIKPGATPYKKLKSRNPSGWPPTGRACTPFPPASVHQSDLEEADYIMINDQLYDTIEPIKAADPRTLPPASNLDTSKKAKPRRPTPPIQIQPNPIQTNEEPLGFPKPEFRTTEPFASDRPNGEDKRKISSKSPRRLSPTKDNIDEVAGAGLSQKCVEKSHSQDDHEKVNSRLSNNAVPNKQEVRGFILENGQPPIHPRISSSNLKKKAKRSKEKSKESKRRKKSEIFSWQDQDESKLHTDAQLLPNQSPDANLLAKQNPREKAHSYDGSQVTHSEEVDFNVGFGVRQRGGAGENAGKASGGVELRDNPDPNLPQTTRDVPSTRRGGHPAFSLRGKNHVSLNGHHKGFSMARSHKKQKIARDWSTGRKRFVASVSCLSTALVGILVGIYAGETPAIQYYIVDLHHYTVLGNVFFFIGLAIPTFFFWPLPLLHGRKPYILGSMVLAMPLLFPQALAVNTQSDPKVAYWRIGLILPRAAMGFVLGFANMNFKSMLTDLFGASLQSTAPHQEHVDEFDVRRHGGGMGIWLGLWTWCALGSIGFGFMIGALVINHLPPALGFYISIAIIAFVMFLNVLCPEPRRNAFRKSVAEVVTEEKVSRRLARGEVKMHLVQTGPKWWGEEFHYGVMLSLRMLRQPGFMVMAIYVAWTYGQMVLNIVLLGALTSKDYKFTSNYVGASVMALPLGAVVAIPFQKASLFSREHTVAPINEDGTPKNRVMWSSHMVRRTIFILVLPFAGLGYTLASSGPPIPYILPILFAGLIGFLSNLALAECHGIMMETFDTSDLQPGMTGRPRGSNGDKQASKRTNYSSFPRVTSAFAITQSIGYLVGAAATGVGGVLTRHLGTQAATGTMAGILLVLSLMLLSVLVRFTDVQIIPEHKKGEMNMYHQARRASELRRASGIQEEEPFRPIIIGNPHHATRRMNLLEMGGMTRFSEIRKKNKLVDENSLEAKHPDRAALLKFEQRIKEKEQEIVGNVRRSLSRHSSRGSRRSNYSFKRGGSDELGEFGRGETVGGGGGVSRGPSAGNGLRGTEMSRRRISERVE